MAEIMGGRWNYRSCWEVALEVGVRGSGSCGLHGLCITIRIEDGGGILWVNGFVEIVIDHADGGGAAGGEALGEFQAEGAAGAFEEVGVAVILVGFAEVNADFFGELFEEAVAAGHGAGEGAADADVEATCGFAAEHGVEGEDFEDVDGFDAEFLSDPCGVLV